ncbi:MAG: phosphate-starvation-inducible PsiE family protein [Anaerostipes sp.]|jgi:phosphate starvation-inducible membrane PsiE
MRQYLKNEVFKLSKWIEFFLSAIISVAVIGGTVWLIKDLILLLSSNPGSDNIYQFVGMAFNLVICVEFIKMLCKHTPDTLVEVLMFAIARQMIAQHSSPLENLLCIVSIAVLFGIRRYLMREYDEVERMIFLPKQKVYKVNELIHVNIPYQTEQDTIGEAVLNNVDLEHEEPVEGHCFYFPGGALRVAKVKGKQVTQVEVIRSINNNIMPKKHS